MSAGNASPIRLLVVDDHFFARLALICALNAEPDLRVVAEADHGEQAIRLFREHRPDVVLLDGQLPGLSGVETLMGLRRESPRARVLMFSVDATEQEVCGALRAGAAGCLPKSAELRVILQAIRAIHAGNRNPVPTSSPVSPSVRVVTRPRTNR